MFHIPNEILWNKKPIRSPVTITDWFFLWLNRKISRIKITFEVMLFEMIWPCVRREEKKRDPSCTSDIIVKRSFFSCKSLLKWLPCNTSLKSYVKCGLIITRGKDWLMNRVFIVFHSNKEVIRLQNLGIWLRSKKGFSIMPYLPYKGTLV